MLRLLADENFDNHIVEGLRRRLASLDIVTVQEAGLSGTNDETILEWATRENRVILTYDVGTMIHYAMLRSVAGKPVSGVIVVRSDMRVGAAIDDILLLIECQLPRDWEYPINFVPLK